MGGQRPIAFRKDEVLVACKARQPPCLVTVEVNYPAMAHQKYELEFIRLCPEVCSKREVSAWVQVAHGPSQAVGLPADALGAAPGVGSSLLVLFRCLTKCGRLSTSCQVPVNQLSNSALIGSWLRIAFKGRSDERGEFTQLKSEIQIRGLVEPRNRTAGEEMIRDLNTASNLGIRCRLSTYDLKRWKYRKYRLRRRVLLRQVVMKENQTRNILRGAWEM